MSVIAFPGELFARAPLPRVESAAAGVAELWFAGRYGDVVGVAGLPSWRTCVFAPPAPTLAPVAPQALYPT